MKKSLLSFLFFAISTIAFSQIIITSTITNVSCFGGSNGSVAVSATGGTGAYTYTWTPTNTNSPNLNLVSAGQYTVIVMDATMATNSLVVTISQPNQLNIIANSNNACFGSCTGSAFLSAFGGTPPYSYAWSNGSTIPQVTNLCAGIYTVQVVDMNGCLASNTAAVIQSPQLNISVSQTNTTCFTSCNGSANLNLTGGTAPFYYQWLPSGANITSVTNLCAGNQSVIVQDASGCAVSYTFNIVTTGTISNLSASITPINETCFQSFDGQINVTLSGSNSGPFSYQWNNGATTQNIANVATGNYWVEITDGSSGCLSLQTTVNYTGINCGSISGNAFIDINNDCIKNIGDNNATYTSILLNPGNRVGYTNWAGNYTVSNLPYGTYSVSLNNYYGNFVPTCSQTIIATINGGNQNSINNNLSLGFNSTTNPDLYLSAYSNGIVPGFVCHVNYQLINLNNVSASGLFKTILPSSFIANITSGSPNTYIISGDTVIWNFNNSSYSGGSTSFIIYFTVPLTIPLGSIFATCMWAQPTVTDLNYVNNTYCYSRYVTGSFDPNDKTVSPIGMGTSGDIAATETDLTYLIRFQNTGNGPAVNIYVKDTLSPNVDINTFEMLGSSHNYNLEIFPSNILKWKFNNIMLPDSNSNEPGSHGYIQYRIKRNNNNTPGTQIKNTAYIYFDFNEPVVTNTALNTIETVTKIKLQSSTENEWTIYPNPSTGALYIANSNSAKEESKIEILNSIGQTVFETTITSNYKNIDLSKLNNGVYFVKIVSDKQSVIKRVVLSR